MTQFENKPALDEAKSPAFSVPPGFAARVRFVCQTTEEVQVGIFLLNSSTLKVAERGSGSRTWADWRIERNDLGEHVTYIIAAWCAHSTSGEPDWIACTPQVDLLGAIEQVITFSNPQGAPVAVVTVEVHRVP